MPHFVRPFARRMDLGEWKIPSSASGLRKALFNVEPLSDARTTLADFFSILLDATRPPAYLGQRVFDVVTDIVI